MLWAEEKTGSALDVNRRWCGDEAGLEAPFKLSKQGAAEDLKKIFLNVLLDLVFIAKKHVKHKLRR